MEIDKLATFAGVLASLALTYVPGLSAWYDQLEGRQKAYVYVGILAVGTVLIALRSCLPVEFNFIPVIACQDWTYFVNLFISAATAGAATYVTTKSLK